MKEIVDMIEAEAEKIRAKYMPNGAINLKLKGGGDGKPQFRYERQQMVKMLLEFGEQRYIAGRSKSIEDIRGFFEWTKAQSFHYDYRGSEFTRDNKVYKFDEVINEYFKAKQLLNKSNHG